MRKLYSVVVALAVFGPNASADDEIRSAPHIAKPGDARTVVITENGVVVTDLLADTPATLKDTSRLSDAPRLEAPLMRDTDELAYEPLVARLKIDHGKLYRTEPIPMARVVEVPIHEAPINEPD